jgi:hypothetical protein
VLVRVYFDEETGDTCVDIVSPADGSAFSPEESLSEQEKKELEGIIQECSNLLDSDIPAFGNTIYSFLQSFESHPSLRDDDFESLEALKGEQKYVDAFQARPFSTAWMPLLGYSMIFNTCVLHFCFHPPIQTNSATGEGEENASREGDRL